MTDVVSNPTAISGGNDRGGAALSEACDQLPGRCFFLAKGFSRIFWGLLIAMALFFGNAAVEVLHAVKLPAYVAGSALAAWGLWILPAGGAGGPRWRNLVRASLALVCLQIYFSPFLEWWKLSPCSLFYFLNVLGLLLASMLVFFFVNLLAADLFRRFQRRGARIEALVFALGVLLLMIAPLVLTAAFSLMAALRYQTDFAGEMWRAFIQLPSWVYMLLTLPCSLTLVALWKAKDMCYRRLTEDAAEQAMRQGT